MLRDEKELKKDLSKTDATIHTSLLLLQVGDFKSNVAISSAQQSTMQARVCSTKELVGHLLETLAHNINIRIGTTIKFYRII